MKPANESSSFDRNIFVSLEEDASMEETLGLPRLSHPRSDDLGQWVQRLREYTRSRGIEGQVMFQSSSQRESVPPTLVFRGRETTKDSDSIDSPTVLDDPLDLQLDTDGRCYSLGVIDPDGTVYISNEYGGEQRSRSNQWHSPMDKPPSGDLAEAWCHDQIMTVLVMDGLGHGPEAFEASQKARDVVENGVPAQPERLMARIHDGISDTRGGAVFVARIDPGRSQISYCSVGNIEARVVGTETRYLFKQNGIAGYQMPEIDTGQTAFNRGDWLVCHTDGVNPPKRDFYDEVFCRLSPALNAVRIHDQFEKGTDDALVFVARA